MNKKAKMTSRGQSGLEYLMTYGWVIVAIAVVLGIIMTLLSNSTTVQQCTMSPSHGALTYVESSAQGSTFTFIIKNETGKTITGVTYAFSGDFNSGVTTPTDASITANSSVTKTVLNTGLKSQTPYNETITISYNRQSVLMSSTLNCTGTVP
jgi:hypothetical protein